MLESLFSFPLVLVLLLILGAEFVNGWTDAPNAIATVVSTRDLSPGKAVIMAATLNILGALIAVFTGAAVATTIGKGIVRPEAIDLSVVAAATLTIIIWTSVAAYFGIPTSESHELIAGLTGAGFAAGGMSVLLWSGWSKVILGLGFSTVIGFTLSVVFMTALNWSLRRVKISTVRRLFSKFQVLSSAYLAFAHGSNDGQKFMGMFALALVLGGVTTTFSVPIWVVLLCGITMGLGTASGGWRIIRTMGFKLTKLESVHGFASQAASGTSILIASSLGIPLSTTHSISSAIMGVGATRRFSAVRWGVAGEIVMTWILTFPICGIMGYLLTFLFKLIF